MKVDSLPISRLSLGVLVCLAAGCAMPPRDAWRIVQTQGLFSYMAGDYATPGQNRYLSSSSPLRPRESLRTSYLDDSGNLPPRRNPVPYRPREERFVANVSDESSEPAPAEAPLRSKSKPRIDAAPPVEKEPPSSAPKFSMDSLPYGTPVSGRPGMVMSPFASKEQLVDVTGMGVGDPVKCPYSGKLFRVPPTQQASSNSSSSTKTIEEPSASPAPAPAPSSTPPPAPSAAPEPAPSAPSSEPAPAKP